MSVLVNGFTLNVLLRGPGADGVPIKAMHSEWLCIVEANLLL